MQVKHMILSLALSAGGLLVHDAALAQNMAQNYRGSWEQQMACTPDVWRLCASQIPDPNRIVACLQANVPQLSDNCRAVFESNDSASPQARTAHRGEPPARIAH
jgi:hypothetical protein